MPVPLFQVDAFSNQPFAGNPAAICLLPEARDAPWMQQVAAENNLSETAFLVRRDDGYDLRWFTPAIEVPLCGHATLAAAHVLWSEGYVSLVEPIQFHSASGVLTATRRDQRIELDFPSKVEEPSDAADGLLDGLRVASPVYVGRNELDYIVQVDSAGIVRGLAPDSHRLRTLEVRGVIVTAVSDRPEFDFISRYFAPGSGIDEDPVTGSAHCCLGPFWQKRLAKDALIGFQASPRGGIVHVQVQGTRTLLSGEACTVLRGELLC